MKSSASVNRRQLRDNRSFFQHVRHWGVKAALAETSWFQLTLLLIIFYLVLGALVGSGLYVFNVVEVSEPELGDHPVKVILLWWMRGFWLVLMNPTYDPPSVGEALITLIIPILGSVVTLMLFGVVYDKFSMRSCALTFATCATLRRAGADLQGHCVLTFRYAHKRGLYLVNPVLKATALTRAVMADGDSIIVQRDIRILGDGSSVLPGAFFCHHIIDEQSPFYTETAPGCSFHAIIAIMISVSGTDPFSQEDHAGYQQIQLDDIICDHKFLPMLDQNKGIGQERKIDFDAFNAVVESDIKDPLQRVLCAGISHKSIGLPIQDYEDSIASPTSPGVISSPKMSEDEEDYYVLTSPTQGSRPRTPSFEGVAFSL